jgi:hypothetical protein
MGGLLDGLSDPKVREEIERRSNLIGRLAEQMGVTRAEAREALAGFEANISHEGQTLQ